MTARRTGDAPRAHPGSVSVTYLTGILTFACECGANRAHLLRTIGLDESMLGDGDRRVPLDMMRLLFDAAASALDDPAFALHFGVGVPCATLTLASALAAARPVPAHVDP